MSKKILAVAIVIIVAISAISSVFVYLNYRQGPSRKMDSVTVAALPLEQDELLYVATNQGFRK